MLQKSIGYKSNMPYLLNISGRHEEAIKAVADEFKSHPIDPEQIALIHNIQERVTTGHLARGYCIISKLSLFQTKLVISFFLYKDDLYFKSYTLTNLTNALTMGQ